MTIQVELTEELFLDFAMFDILRKRKGWLPPVAVSVAFILLSVVCFIMGKTWQNLPFSFIGVGLIVLAMLFPLIYFLTFFRAAKKQISQLKLPSLAYIAEFTPENLLLILMASGQPKIFKEEDIDKIYFLDDAAYVYIADDESYILPDSNIQGGVGALISLVSAYMPESKLIDKR